MIEDGEGGNYWEIEMREEKSRGGKSMRRREIDTNYSLHVRFLAPYLRDFCACRRPVCRFELR